MSIVLNEEVLAAKLTEGLLIDANILFDRLRHELIYPLLEQKRIKLTIEVIDKTPPVE